MEVGEYRVMAEMGATLIALLSKHGDIAANCSLQSLSCRSFFWEIACRIFQKLEEAELKNLDETDLKTIIADIDDLESVNMEVGWLRKRLNEITERPKVGEFCFKVEGVRRRRSNGAAKMEIETEEGNTDWFLNLSPDSSREDRLCASILARHSFIVRVENTYWIQTVLLENKKYLIISPSTSQTTWSNHPLSSATSPPSTSILLDKTDGCPCPYPICKYFTRGWQLGIYGVVL